MQIKFKELTLQNFKSHQELSVNFGERTDILGDNAKGKSSIGEAITFLLYGLDTLGSKLDPTPDTYEADSTKVELLFEVDEKDVKLGREIVGGRNKYIVNDVPSKATEFNQVVEQLFDRDIFLSLFNPTYFFTLHWEKQRGMILQYVSAPANKEVFAELPDPQADKLAELVKKHSLEDLDKIHRANKNKQDKAYIAAQAKTKTLKGQMDEFKQLVPLPSLRTELNIFTKKRDEAEKIIEDSWENNSKINTLHNQIKQLTDKRDQMKNHWEHLKNEEIEENCRVCQQPLKNESIKAVEADKQKRIDTFKAEFNQVVEDRKKLEAELKNLEYIDVSEQQEIARENQAKIGPIEQEMNKHNRFEVLQEQIAEAEKTEKETLKSLNESIFIIDAIKAFHAKEAELQAKKVQDLLDNLTIKLFETIKTTGELKPTFVVQMDGKDYPKLSLSESIRAGLELRDVLSDQSGIIAPCFVDNAESITKFKEPNGQLILARVVEGKELEVVAIEDTE